MNRQPSVVTVHYAQTLDGRIATRTGQSQWISGEASLRLAHELRAGHRVIMVGVGTVIADNSRLTLRLAEGRSPVRVVVDSRLRIPLDANVLCDGLAPTIIATTPSAPAERIEAITARGARILVVASDRDERVDVAALLRELASEGLDSVLIEGGARLITSALRARVVDRLIVGIAPKVVGAGIEAVGDLGIGRLNDALAFERFKFTTLGDDLIFDGWLRAERARAA